MPQEALYCPAESMRLDRMLDMNAWENQRDAGSSYAYYWGESREGGRPQGEAGDLVTYIACKDDRPALTMDGNCNEGHGYTGEYQGTAWPSHPTLDRTNIGFIDGAARSYEAEQVKLEYPGGPVDELLWFLKAHKLHR